MTEEPEVTGNLPPAIFYDRVQRLLEPALAEACQTVPEVEAIATVVLWRMPDQSSVPSVWIKGSDGPLVAPDQWLRLLRESVRLAGFCSGNADAAVVLVMNMADQMAGDVRRSHEIRTETANQPEQEA